MKIKVKRLYQDSKLPSKVFETDIGFDLFSREVTLKAEGDLVQVVIKTGVAVTPPKGYYCEIVPRSSITKHNLLLHNSVGIIDPEYTGELRIILWAPSISSATSFLNDAANKPNHAIAQLILRKAEYAEVEEVDELNVTSRGSGGFGSTDKVRTAEFRFPDDVK